VHWHIPDDNTSIYSTPVWSPDGNSLLFLSNMRGSYDIFALSLESHRLHLSDAHQITTGFIVGVMDWSPDGQQVVFSSGQQFVSDLYLVNVDGTRLRRFTDDRSHYFQPSWSPNSDTILFASDRNQQTQTDIFTLDLSRNIINALVIDSQRLLRSPKWSSDGTRIAFAGESFIFIADTNGEITQTISTPFTVDYVTWSPDDTQIMFTENLYGGVYTVLLEDETVTELFDRRRGIYQPDWRPR